jgi:signal peptidase
MKKILAFTLVLVMIISIFTSCGRKANDDENKPRSFFGYTFLNVLTDGMEPLMKEADLIVVKKVDPNSIKVGDVISFFDPGSPTDAILTHRVISIYEEDGVRYAITAGDNNANNDYQRDVNNAKKDTNDPDGRLAEVQNKATIMKDEKDPSYEYVVYKGHRDSKAVALTEDEIVGAYIYTRIPVVGKISMFMQTTWGWVICIAVPLIAFIAFELISRKKKDKNKDKDMNALLAELEALKAAKAVAEAGEAPASAPENDSTDSSNEANDAPKE